jgi:hypothetical protein
MGSRQSIQWVHDAAATMGQMTRGNGRENLTSFYAHHFIYDNSQDTELELLSQFVGVDRNVDDFIWKFTLQELNSCECLSTTWSNPHPDVLYVAGCQAHLP